MTSTKNSKKLASILAFLLILFSIALTYGTSEDNYKNDTNILPNISESTHTENGYKASIIANPHTTGVYAQENGYKLDTTINPKGIGGKLTENNYKLETTPEKTFPEIPDVAITEITTSKTVVGQGFSMLIKVTVTNQAFSHETFYVTIQANTTTIETQTVTITSRSSTTITFTWNTIGFAKGKYILSAYATPIPGETDTADNSYTDGKVAVAMIGDVNADGKVNAIDLATVAQSYRTTVGDPFYNPNADINNDNRVDLWDLTYLALNYGKTDP